jgi:hypothetical protein
MVLRLQVVLASALCALALPVAARAVNGNYVFDGGTAAERAQVRDALDASAFDWNLVPAQITIHITRGGTSQAIPGQIWLDADLLDSGRFSWGVVQHEYGHQVDFFLLDDGKRSRLAAALGGKAWWNVQAASSLAPNRTLLHAQLTSERFASTLAWAYWPSPDNALRPQTRTDESAAMQPPAFRALLAQLIGAPAALSARRS